jgi:hypothetical protein
LFFRYFLGKACSRFQRLALPVGAISNGTGAQDEDGSRSADLISQVGFVDW